MGKIQDAANEMGMRVGIGAGIGGLVGVLVHNPVVIALGFIIMLPILVVMTVNVVIAAKNL